MSYSLESLSILVMSDAGLDETECYWDRQEMHRRFSALGTTVRIAQSLQLCIYRNRFLGYASSHFIVIWDVFKTVRHAETDLRDILCGRSK